jgi:acetoin utilization deacetylase AcuC-like enzyme
MFKIANSSRYIHPLPSNHRFPMAKYDLLPQQLSLEGIAEKSDFFEPQLCDEEFLLQAHTLAYWQKLKTLSLDPKEIRKTGFPLSQELIDRERTLVEGSIRCVDYAFTDGVAMNIAGGTHHAGREKGEGFCLLNDLAIAGYYALSKPNISRALQLDLDVHQGNGTADIFKNEPKVFTFSMHGKNNFPLRKEQSDLDIPLDDHTNDQEYLDTLEQNLSKVIESFKPQFICYQSGVDILETDKLGKLSLSIAGCKERDRMVFETTAKLNIPIIAAMGGGYSPKIKDIIEAHANTYRVAKDCYY